MTVSPAPVEPSLPGDGHGGAVLVLPTVASSPLARAAAVGEALRAVGAEPSPAAGNRTVLLLPLARPERPRPVPEPADAAVALPESLRHWATAVRDSGSPCLLVDRSGRLVAESVHARDLLGHRGEGPTDAGERYTALRSMHSLVATGHDRDPVALTLETGRLIRQLLRCDRPDGPVTVDVVCVPLAADGATVGALVWLSVV